MGAQVDVHEAVGCKCLDRVDGLLREKGCELNRAFWFSDKDSSMTVSIGTKKIDGSRGKATAIKPTFCPFCGVRYGAQS